MNQEQVGKFIAKLRKEKRYTQESLAESLGVSSKTISKWETGNGLPDIFMLKNLAEKLDVSPLELINGKRISNVDKNKDIDPIYSSAEKYIENNNKKYKKRIIIISITSIIALGIVSLLLLLLSNYNNCFIYSLKGNDDYYLEGFIVDSLEKDIISITNIQLLDSKANEKVCYSYDYSLIIGDMTIFQFGNILDESINQEKKSLYNVLNTINIYSIEDSNYDSILEEKLANNEEFYLNVNCANENKTISSIKIPIKKEIIFSNNKYIFKKGKEF